MIPTLRSLRLTALLAATCASLVLCPGALVWDSQVADLTAMSGDKEVAANFHFRNTGTTPVTITNIGSSCGCTTAELAKRTYQPGEDGTIKTVFTIGVRTGQHEKEVHITTDEAPDKPVTLKLRANIKELLIFAPQVLLWDKADETEKTVLVSAAETKLPASPETSAAKEAGTPALEAVNPQHIKVTSVEITSVEPKDAAVTRIEPTETSGMYRIGVRLAPPPNPAPSGARKVTISCLANFDNHTTQRFVVYALAR